MHLRPISSGVLAVTLAAGTAMILPAVAAAEPATTGGIVINEVESNGDPVGDWVELANLDTENELDLSGWSVLDGDPTHDPIVFPEGTVIESGGYWSLYTDLEDDGFGLGGNDSVTLFDASGEIVDSTTWEGHAPTTWGRIPDMTGEFAVTGEPTRNARNAAADAEEPIETEPWPSDPLIVSPVALDGDFADEDMSGVDIAADGTAYVVNNGTGTLHVLAYDPAAGSYSADRTFTLRYPDGTGTPDAEGVTVGADGAVYVATERNNDASGTSRPSVLRVDLPTDRDSGELAASVEYDLSALTGPLGANSGLEAVEYLPEAWGGAFAVGVEGTGIVHFVSFGAEGAVTELQAYASPFQGVMALDHEVETGALRVLCDEVCEGRSLKLTFDGTQFVTDGTLHDRPAGMGNLANEGFAAHRESVPCSDDGAEGAAERIRFLWADDAATEGAGLRTAVSAEGECNVGDDDSGPDLGMIAGSLESLGVGLGSVTKLLPALPA